MFGMLCYYCCSLILRGENKALKIPVPVTITLNNLSLLTTPLSVSSFEDLLNNKRNATALTNRKSVYSDFLIT